MEENEFQWEVEAGLLNEKYHHGKLIYQRLEELDSDDAYERELFFDDGKLRREVP